MVKLEKRINAFVKLGDYLRGIGTIKSGMNDTAMIKLIEESHIINPWFTAENVKSAMVNIGESLTTENLNHWAGMYAGKLNNERPVRRVGVVMAGNIPLVGFHDFLSVLFSGNTIIARLSSDDNRLMPALATRLIEIEPDFTDHIIFCEGKLENFDAVIATGSNNTSRYFEYYFRNVPHIIRKNRNGIAVLTGNETDEELALFGQDIFLYFGLGCRSVSKAFVPKGYSFGRLFESMQVFSPVGDHNKYRNNYDYYKSIYLINGQKHLDNGFLLIKEDQTIASPPSVLYFEEYEDVIKLNSRLQMEHDQIQCVVSHSPEIERAIPFGRAQQPELWDYADGVDSLEFLLNL